MPPKTALGRWLKKRKDKKTVRSEAERLQPQIQQNLNGVMPLLVRVPPGTLHDAMLLRHGELTQRLQQGAPQDTQQAASYWSLLGMHANELCQQATAAAAAGDIVNQQAVNALDRMVQDLNSRTQGVRDLFDTERQRIVALEASVHLAFNQQQFNQAQTLASEVQTASTALQSKLNDATKFVTQRDLVIPKVTRLQNDLELTMAAAAQMPRLPPLLLELNGHVASERFKSARETVDEIDRIRRLIAKSAKAKGEYDLRRVEVHTALTNLGLHAQAGQMGDEIAELHRLLTAADAVGNAETGGWQKARSALELLKSRIDATGNLATKLGIQLAKVPGMVNTLTTRGMKGPQAQKLAGYAAKILCEQSCSEDDALAMAVDASNYMEEGMSEPQALMSSRVKAQLVADGVDPRKAMEVGRAIRCAGTANAKDAGLVASKLAKLSEAALRTLRANDFKTVACRGSITEVLPDLAGERPRGWPEDMSWDTVPGICSSSTKQVVIGTIGTQDGDRKVPDKGDKDPQVKHGACDLVGHEAGHAFDAAGGGTLKCLTPAFVSARRTDLSTVPPRMIVPRDNYYLTKTEGGDNTSGALSETFAESFAMHFMGGAKWTEVEAFWSRNPWGI